MIEHKIFTVDIGALSWSVSKQWKNLLSELNQGWEIVYEGNDEGFPFFILKRVESAPTPTPDEFGGK
jgi:hypothetical protein